MEKHNHIFERVALIVFTKTPGQPAKTRIAKTEGKDVANQIYLELLNDCSQKIKEFPYHVAFAGQTSQGALSSIFCKAISFFPQTGKGLGDRMKNACLHCEKTGYSQFIVIGCDCPERNANDILLTAKNLKKGFNVVLGPVKDGGYHLAGIDNEGLKIFEATKWSSKELLEETLSITKAHKLKTMLLPMKTDIDTIEDYRHWKLHFANGDV